MTVEEIIYDVLEILNALEDDRDVEDLWILQKINYYRAILIDEQYRVSMDLNPAWLLRIRKFDFEKVTAADDPAITVNSVTLGKATLPQVVSLSEDLGFNRISGSGGIIGFEPTDFDTLVMKSVINEYIHPNYGYYTRIGNDVYVYPYIMEGSAIIIPENPMDVQVLDNGSMRDRIFSDPYPLDAKLAQMAIMQLLTNDLNIAQQSISDIINDSQTELKILKDEGTAAKKRS